MNTTDSIASRRAAILARAAGEMDRAHARRIRRARITTALTILALGAAVAAVLPRAVPRPAEKRTLAIDFQTVTGTTRSVDFSIVRATAVPLLDTLTDAEAEQALEEAGYCVRILRVRDNPMLVDCSTGARAVIR